MLIENGGKVVDENRGAHYVVFEDGYDPLIW
jgi:hypothetical protein